MRPSTPFGVLAIVLAASFAPPRSGRRDRQRHREGTGRHAVPRRLRAGAPCRPQNDGQRAHRQSRPLLRREPARGRLSDRGALDRLPGGCPGGREARRPIRTRVSTSPSRGAGALERPHHRQGAALLPEARGKKTLMDNCMSCHGFQSRMAATMRDEDGWRDRVSFMREAMRSSLADRQGFSDEQAEDVISYLTTMFGENSPLPKSPADLPGYKDDAESLQRRGAENRLRGFRNAGAEPLPWTANPDADGYFWIPEYGQANKMARLKPATGEIKEFPAPESRPGADPFGGAGSGRLGMDHRSRRQEAWPLGSGDPEDHRISRTTGASTPSASTPTARSGRPAA